MTIALLWVLGLSPAPMQAQDIPQQVTSHFREAQAAANAGDLDRAAQEYQSVLTLDPTLVEARVNLGLVYHALGHYEQAIAEFGKVLRARPDSFPANLFIGIGYAKLGFSKKALPALRRAAQAQPSNREARRALAGCLLAEEDYQGAMEQFRTLFTLEANKAEAWYSLGHSYLEMVMDLVNRMALRNGASPWTKRLAGDLQSEGGGMSLNDAAASYRRALALAPSQPGLHALLGRVELRQGKVEEAEQEFQKELHLDPYHEEAWIGLAGVHLARGQAASALEGISRIWATFPLFLSEPRDFPSIGLLPDLVDKLIADLDQQTESPARAFLLAALFKLAGEPAKAEHERGALQDYLKRWQNSGVRHNPPSRLRVACASHDYSACIELLKSRKDLSVGDALLLGKAYLRMQQPLPASDVFASALAQSPNNLEPAYWLARTYMKLASDCFAQLTSQFPDSWRTHELRGEEYRVCVDYPNAIKEYQVAVKLKPDEAELHEKLGELYLSFHKKPVAEAKAELEKALALDPSRPRTLYLLGKICLMKREYQAAIPLLRGALRFEPNLLGAHAGLGRALLRTGEVELAARELERAVGADYYGDLHYQLYDAYRQLGKTELAMKALARSQELRKESVANQMAKIASAELE
jgi:tetratricopeptide (TPR) repeat protein